MRVVRAAVGAARGLAVEVLVVAGMVAVATLVAWVVELVS
ncbi:MAG: hypothetical protein KatS3mg011_1155 [Acidimicrobiia bacterium]|nr:MAG: hypothetical protein KatS3mg011_1155 [Acidimicrobiia bacterium]